MPVFKSLKLDHRHTQKQLKQKTRPDDRKWTCTEISSTTASPLCAHGYLLLSLAIHKEFSYLNALYRCNKSAFSTNSALHLHQTTVTECTHYQKYSTVRQLHTNDCNPGIPPSLPSPGILVASQSWDFGITKKIIKIVLFRVLGDKITILAV